MVLFPKFERNYSFFCQKVQFSLVSSIYTFEEQYFNETSNVSRSYWIHLPWQDKTCTRGKKIATVKCLFDLQRISVPPSHISQSTQLLVDNMFLCTMYVVSYTRYLITHEINVHCMLFITCLNTFHRWLAI